MKLQLIRFGSVGAFVTLIDFLFLNIILVLGFSFLEANITSVTIAMFASYYLNKNYVFSQKNTTLKQKLLFLVGTVFALYGLQSLIIYLFSLERAFIESIIEGISQDARATDFIYINFVKVIATFVSALSNFIFYKYIVFR